MTTPDPELGWEILHEYADRLLEHQRGSFTADARLYEAVFTSGSISETQYRVYLDLLVIDHQE